MTAMRTRVEKGGNGTAARLRVNGSPFLLLGIQWSCDLSEDEAYAQSYLPAAKALGCNTAVIPIYWKSIEPEQGRYETGRIANLVRACRAVGLKLALLWFGAYKNGQMFYAPDWVYEDEDGYPRAVARDGSRHKNTSCPSARPTHERDKLAFLRVLEAVKEIDADEQTVILMQIENEPGLLTGDRCYCEVCNEAFGIGAWADPESFTATLIARWIGEIAREAKSRYPIPLYANAWLDTEYFRRPGVDYPSGGPGIRNLEIYRREAPDLDLLAPDTYRTAYLPFKEVCEHYGSNGNPLYIAEHSLYGAEHRADKNLLYALFDHGAIGFDPYCINNNEDPAVLLGESGQFRFHPRIQDYRDALKLVNDAFPLVAEHRGTESAKAFVREEGEPSKLLDFGKYSFLIEYVGPKAKGFVIRVSEDEFYAAGTDVRMVVCSGRTGSVTVPRSLEWGRFEGAEWRAAGSGSRETCLGFVPFGTSGIVRLSLAETSDWQDSSAARFTQ